MAKYKSKYLGYSFGLEPEKNKFAKFVNGIYETNDEEIIRKLDIYAYNHSDELNRIDQAEDTVKIIQDAFKKAKKNTEFVKNPKALNDIIKDELSKEKVKGSQGVIG